MDYQEAQVIADTAESGMSTLTDWLLVKITGKLRSFHRYEFLLSEPIFSKLKPLVENPKKEKQGSYGRN